MKRITLTTLITIALLALALTAEAEVPTKMNYQGQLLNDQGEPVADGIYSLVFAIYDVPTAGTPYWTSGARDVEVKNGLFTYVLGSFVPLPETLFESHPMYLGITVGSDTEIDPRTELVSVPYSFSTLRSDTAGYALSGGSADDDWTISGDDMFANVSGDVGIGAPTPMGKLHVENADGHYAYLAGSSKSVYGENVNGNYGGIGTNSYGVYGSSTGNGYVGVGGYGEGGTTWSYGVSGYATGADCPWNAGVDAVVGSAGLGAMAFHALAAGSDESYTKYGYDAEVSFGGTNFGVHTYVHSGTNNIAIYGRILEEDPGHAGVFSGDVAVYGTLTKDAGAFRIDHPLDPENKYLQHSFVESPDMMNIYNGNVTTDADGFAVVRLPDYFSALNMEFRYQLTVIGQFAQAIIAEKISENRFSIRTDKPNVEVSWQVTGIRNDPYAQEHRIEVEIDKPANEQGYYINPRLYGFGDEKNILHEDFERTEEMSRSYQENNPHLR